MPDVIFKGESKKSLLKALKWSSPSYRRMMSLVIILCWIADLSFGASPLFKVPDAFKTRIYGKTSGLEGEEFTIEQYQQSVKTQIIRKTVVRSGQMDDGLIYDETRNHSTLFNFSHCLSNEIGPSSPHRYHLGSIGSIPILDPILLILVCSDWSLNLPWFDTFVI